jgi:mono/diheme cytochrome c family protein
MNTLRAHWQRSGPVRRIFTALGLFLSTIALICSVLITTELIAGYAAFPWARDLNDVKKPSAATLEHGAYLAKVGNCAACHTARGGAAFAGGKAIHTPFGAVYTSNITPDIATGIGRWSAQAFYRAMHEGRSADGRMLTPAFPYTNYTHVTRQDTDALYAYFMHGVQPVAQANTAHALPFPFNTQLALAVWRVLFFEAADALGTAPAIQPAASIAPATPASSGHQATIETIATHAQFPWASGTKGTKNAEIERGAYLMRGLGHCSACHAQRNALGATRNDLLLGGALMPMQDWYAPSLMDATQAGVMHWPVADVVALLQTGVAPSASVAGPMAEVVAKSTQYWSLADLQATAAYLQSLPETIPTPQGERAGNAPAPDTHSGPYLRGSDLFAQHCATCHGALGQGLQLAGSNGLPAVALPALAGNRAVSMANAANMVRIIVGGGYAPSTAGNPRPFGMPPFVHVLSDEDIAAVTTYVRTAWGNQGTPVSAAQVLRHRKGLMN